MRNITLKRLELRHFKGIKNLDIDLDQITNIRGENATGKTTIFDAFTWLLFDKDSKDRTAFDIKTLDEKNEPLHGLDHSVTGVLDIDGKIWTLKKTYKEKWTKRRGDVNKELTGHETIHEINDVPVSKTEYMNKVNDFLDADLFRLITNPLFFSNSLDWKKRRTILLEILGDLTTEQIMTYNPALEGLREHLERAEDIDSLVKQIKASKAKLNTEIKSIPTRIDEASRSVKDLDFKSLEKEKLALEKDLEKLQESLSDNSVNNEARMRIKDDIYDIKNQMKDFEYNYKNKLKKEKQPLLDEIDSLRNKIEDEENSMRKATRELKIRNMDLEGFEIKLASKKKEYVDASKKELDIPEHIKECPTCKRAFDDGVVHEQVESLKGNFKLEKSKKLENIIKYAEAVKEDQEITTAKVHEIEQEMETIKQTIKELAESYADEIAKLNNLPDEPFTNTKEYLSMEENLVQLEVNFQSDDGAKARKELKDKELQLKIEINVLTSQLSYQSQNDDLRKRVKELEVELKETSQKFADMEKIEFLCEEFIRTKVELLETTVNEKFSKVSFKLFTTQVNGGLSETCEALIDGVPFSSANTGSQLNAGLDIINTLNETYQVTAPVFLDNRESVTKIIDTKSQIINLFVDANEKTLRVEE